MGTTQSCQYSAQEETREQIEYQNLNIQINDNLSGKEIGSVIRNANYKILCLSSQGPEARLQLQVTL